MIALIVDGVYWMLTNVQVLHRKNGKIW